MAQTNDENFKKVLSKHGSRRSRNDWVDENNIPIHPETIEIIKEMGTEARLAALDDCKTLLERVLSENLQLKQIGDYDLSSDNVARLRDNGIRHKVIKQALAELEALRKKVEW